MNGESKISKPIIVRKGSKSQNRINLPVTSDFKIGDEVVVLSYNEYLKKFDADSNSAEDLEKANNRIAELEEELIHLKQSNKELVSTNKELNDKVLSLSADVTEEVRAGKFNSTKVAELGEKVNGLSGLISSNEVAYTNGINYFITLTENVIKSAGDEIVNNANEVMIKNNEADLEKVNQILKNTGIFKRVKGVTIAPEEVSPNKVTSTDLKLTDITARAIKELETHKPIYKLE